MWVSLSAIAFEFFPFFSTSGVVTSKWAERKIQNVGTNQTDGGAKFSYIVLGVTGVAAGFSWLYSFIDFAQVFKFQQIGIWLLTRRQICEVHKPDVQSLCKWVI